MSDKELDKIIEQLVEMSGVFRDPTKYFAEQEEKDAQRERVQITTSIEIQSNSTFLGSDMCKLDSMSNEVVDDTIWLNKDLIEAANIILNEGYDIYTGMYVYRDDAHSVTEELFDDIFEYATKYDEPHYFIMHLWDLQHIKYSMHTLCLVHRFYPDDVPHFDFIREKVDRCTKLFAKKYPLTSSLLPNLHVLICEKYINEL